MILFGLNTSLIVSLDTSKGTLFLLEGRTSITVKATTAVTAVAATVPTDATVVATGVADSTATLFPPTFSTLFAKSCSSIFDLFSCSLLLDFLSLSSKDSGTSFNSLGESFNSFPKYCSALKL